MTPVLKVNMYVHVIYTNPGNSRLKAGRCSKMQSSCEFGQKQLLGTLFLYVIGIIHGTVKESLT